jgi:uncharacterized membrane protein
MQRVAIGFDDPAEADRVLSELHRLHQDDLLDVDDAVVAIRPPHGEVQLKQSVNLKASSAAAGLVSGGRFGLLIGLLFQNPLAGFALGGLAGTGVGAFSGSLLDYGIDDDFMRSLAQALPPNGSALFVLARKVQPDRVLAELSRFRGRVLHTTLSLEQEQRLKAELSGVNPAPAPSPPARTDCIRRQPSCKEGRSSPASSAG